MKTDYLNTPVSAFNAWEPAINPVASEAQAVEDETGLKQDKTAWQQLCIELAQAVEDMDGIITENCNLKEKIALQDRVLESQKRYIASLEQHFITLDEMIKRRDNMLAEANDLLNKLSAINKG